MTSTNPETGRLLKPDEVAERLRCSRQTVYRRVAAGEIEALAIGTGPRPPLRIRAGEVERYLTMIPTDPEAA